LNIDYDNQIKDDHELISFVNDHKIISTSTWFDQI